MLHSMPADLHRLGRTRDPKGTSLRTGPRVWATRSPAGSGAHLSVPAPKEPELSAAVRRTAFRSEETGRLDGEKLSVGLASNVENLGGVVHRVTTIEALKAALHKAKEHQDGRDGSRRGGPASAHTGRRVVVGRPLRSRFAGQHHHRATRARSTQATTATASLGRGKGSA
jgi:hypothetical protein